MKMLERNILEKSINFRYKNKDINNHSPTEHARTRPTLYLQSKALAPHDLPNP